ncbi:MAG: hypothetical protein MMC33_004964 [Icmadophila ericetorum]|nr:hypothetical protein [Icmadophila ericetorum]
MRIISQTMLFKRFLPAIDSVAQGHESIDVLEWNFAMFMDFVTAYLFGLGNGSNFLQDLEYRKHWLAIYNDRNANNFVPQELWKSILHTFGTKVVPEKTIAANKEIEEWVLRMCQAAESIRMSDVRRGTSPVVYRQLFQSLTKAELDPWSKYPKDLTVASEMLDHLAAGHETSAITLTYLMHEISKRPEMQDALRAELLTLSPPVIYPSAFGPDPMRVPNPRSIDSLPLLQAILLETLRRHAAIPGPQPRITPFNQSTPAKLGQYSNIPGGVRVSALAYTLHRNPEVFPDPEEWKPERWLDASEEQRAEMDRWFWAFGSGGRMCIGKNLALLRMSYSKSPHISLQSSAPLTDASVGKKLWKSLTKRCRIELNLVIAAIYTNFRTEIINDTGIEQEDSYTARPVGNKLVLKFERVNNVEQSQTDRLEVVRE